jgi:hypothetical protein
VVYVLLRAGWPRLSRGRLGTAYLVILAGLALFARVEPRAMGRSAAWTPGWFDVRVPRLAAMPGAIVLTELSNSFVFPFLPADDRFIRLHRTAQERLDREIQSAIAQHTGPILYFQPIGARMLAPLGLREQGHCERLDTSRGTFRICLAERATTP